MALGQDPGVDARTDLDAQAGPGECPARARERPDLDLSGWWALEQRETSRASNASPVSSPGTVGPVSSWDETCQAEAVSGGGASAGTATSSDALAGPPASAGTGPELRVVPPAPRRRRHTLFHLWALVKAAFLVWNVEWAMSYVHAKLAEDVCAYGALCLFAGVGARWRKRFFGPAQLVRPELYEDIGQWLYRVGTVLVICGGVLYLLPLH
jgi:hypothetical protein